MFRAQRGYLSGVTSIVGVMVVLSGFATVLTTQTPAKAQQTNPDRCPVDIIFAIDNSGSMDDNGANDVLKNKLVPRLRDYFNTHLARGDRGALFTYSYDGNARRHVSFNRQDSVKTSLNRIAHLTFSADGSAIVPGIREASDYARNNAQPGRKQFIFLGGDEQAPQLNENVRQRIKKDGDDYGIKYYTFALRQYNVDYRIFGGGTRTYGQEPYRTIAEISANHTDGKVRFYQAGGFQDSLAADMDSDACGPPPSEALKFCVEDANTEAPLAGAQISDLSGDYFQPNPPNNDAPHLVTGGDGCTNPMFINYAKLKAGDQYPAQASKSGYVSKSISWLYRGDPRLQIVTIKLTPSTRQPGDSAITNVTKQATPSKLNPGQTQTTVEIGFSVDGDNPAVKDIVMHEELSSVMSFDAAPNFKLVNPDGTEKALTANVAGKKATISLGSLTPAGVYSVKFNARFTGPGDDKGYPIDFFASNACTSKSGSRIEFIGYTQNKEDPGCELIEEGIISQSGGNKMILESDVLFGNKALTLNNQLTLGANSNLIVTGQTVTGDTGSSILFDRNNIPTGGKLSWNALKTNVNSVVNRWIKTNAVRIWTCPGGVLNIGEAGKVTELNLNNGKTNPLQPDASSGRAKSFTMWLLKNPAATGDNDGCTVNVNGTVLINGTGTLVNRGGQAFIYGTVASSSPISSKYVLGYVGMAQPGVANSGRVVLYDQSAVTGAIIYTDGTIEIGTSDATVAAGQVKQKTHRSTFIGQSMKFPSLKSLRTTITLGAFAGRNAFPPFVQTYLPQSEAAP